MKVSFIVPVFNGGEYLREAVESILAASADGVETEIVMVDDASDDAKTCATLIELAELPGVKLVRRRFNGGPAAARNSGIRAAGGEWISFLDADDLLMPEAMQIRCQALRRHPQARWIMGGVRLMIRPGEFAPSGHNGPDGIRHGGSPAVVEARLPATQLVSWNPASGSAMIAREVFEAAGVFDEDFRIGEDWYFWMLVAMRFDLFWIDAPLLTVRRHHVSMTSNALHVAREMPRVMAKAMRDPRFGAVRHAVRWRLASELRRASASFRSAGARRLSLGAALRAVACTPTDIRSVRALLASLT